MKQMNGNLISWILGGLLAVVTSSSAFIVNGFNDRMAALETGQREIREILIGKGIIEVDGSGSKAMIDLLQDLSKKMEAIQPRSIKELEQ